MEALAHGHLPLSALRTCQKEHRCHHVGSIHFLTSPVPSSLKFSAPIKYRSGIIRMQEKYELKQMKDMAAAKKRWDSLIRDGKVKVLTPREAGYAIQLSNKTLLDVRPSMERKKAWVKGSTWIPIFDVDTSLELGILSRKATNFLLGRSIAACEVLYNAGYNNIFWVQGGLEAAEEEDLEREGPQPFKFAGIGGLSEFLGWTDQQRDAAAKEGWGYRLTFSARLVGVVLAADALFIGAQKVGQYIQELRTH
ncbi:rhodanese-like domain-containing protein 11, chloroplastic isoform X3 [Nicotiana tabacum]|uniref:Rhodanese-like domain-containing protein 11, chloroplastic isoform X3 n=1 Tax=Nicotiana tabacum TaxID=4097 RepID=A0A1S4BPC6_TOBAC|nr:PREDICTED: rhodanese-like domain-containing protein 11, chloroplastic isoform X3 [Nicotiana tabacum]